MIAWLMGSPEAMNHDPRPSEDRNPDEPCAHEWIPTGRSVLNGDGDEIREVRCRICRETDVE